MGLLDLFTAPFEEFREEFEPGGELAERGFDPAPGLFGDVIGPRTPTTPEADVSSLTDVQFPGFQEVDADFSQLRTGLLQQLQQGQALGTAQGRGSLAKAGLLGTGGEAALAELSGIQGQLGAAGLEKDLFLAQLDFDTLQQTRQNTFNQAEALFNQGQNEAAARLLLEYDRMTAKLQARAAQDKGAFGDLFDIGVGLLSGGAGGASPSSLAPVPSQGGPLPPPPEELLTLP